MYFPSLQHELEDEKAPMVDWLKYFIDEFWRIFYLIFEQ